MKALNALQFIFCCLLILLNVGCRKADDSIGVDDGQVNVDEDLNRVHAGSDRMIAWPNSKCSLGVWTSTVGYGRYAPNGPLLLSWRMISGPDTPQIQTIENGRIEVSQLSIGVYQFEVSFDKRYGNFNKDSCRIVVDTLSNPPKEIFFLNQNWTAETSQYSWGSWIYIKDIYDKIPPESAFKIFIRQGSNSGWEELLPEEIFSWYHYSFKYKGGAGSTDKGEITIWPTDYNYATGKVDIKLLY